MTKGYSCDNIYLYYNIRDELYSDILNRIKQPRDYERSVYMLLRLTLIRIEGDYAILLSEAQEEISVARALLPSGAGIGSRLEYDFSDFRLID